MHNYPLDDLFWECTLRCNACCAFCGSRCGEVASPELTTEQAKEAFRQIAEGANPQKIMINVTGGEPLLRKDLFEVMGYCAELGFPWGMVSNGSLITEDAVEKLRHAGLRTLTLSLDGLEETHEALRGLKGGYRKIMEALGMFRKADFLEHLQVTTVVSRRNIGELDRMYEVLKPLALDSWRVVMVDPIGRGRDREDLLLDAELVERYLSFIRTHRNDSELPVVSSCAHWYGEEGLGRGSFACRAGRNIASILANGDIFVCPNVPRDPELIQGNVLRDSFWEVWEKGFRHFRDPDGRKGPDCDRCPDWIRCLGDSAHTWDWERGEPLFCWRRLHPVPQDARPSLKEVLLVLRERTPGLRGLHIRYGWRQGLPVVLTPNAAQELYSFFHWGERHPQNLSEQLGILIGHRLRDAVLVEFVSPAWLDRRSNIEAVFSVLSLWSAKTELDAINAHYDALRTVEGPCILLGFVHSHPDDLGLFLSEPDVRVHEIIRREGMEISMLVNPQKRQLAVYHGEELLLAELRILTTEDRVADWGLA